MHRRTFLGGAATLIAALPAATAASAHSSTEAVDEEAVKKFIADWYAAFGNPKVDRTYYRSFLAPNYLLLENGELLDADGDVAMLDGSAIDLVRHDQFDFRRVWFGDDRAFLVYFLDSQMTDSKNGARKRRYLESAILKRDGRRWQAELLHSTRVSAKS